MAEQRPRCNVTGKIMFSTKEEAAKAAPGLARGRNPLRAYRNRCPFCDSYHTSKGVRGPGK